jgi:hypothetical protein
MNMPSPDLAGGAAVLEAEKAGIDATGRKIATNSTASEVGRRKSLGKAVAVVSGVAKDARRGARRLLAGHVMRGPGTCPKITLTVESATGDAIEDGAAVKGAFVEGVEVAL